jgi:hypothetical protein
MDQVWPFFCDYKLRQCSLGSRRFETTISPLIIEQFLTEWFLIRSETWNLGLSISAIIVYFYRSRLLRIHFYFKRFRLRCVCCVQSASCVQNTDMVCFRSPHDLTSSRAVRWIMVGSKTNFYKACSVSIARVDVVMNRKSRSRVAQRTQILLLGPELVLGTSALTQIQSEKS